MKCHWNLVSFQTWTTKNTLPAPRHEPNTLSPLLVANPTLEMVERKWQRLGAYLTHFSIRQKKDA